MGSNLILYWSTQGNIAKVVGTELRKQQLLYIDQFLKTKATEVWFDKYHNKTIFKIFIDINFKAMQLSTFLF